MGNPVQALALAPHYSRFRVADRLLLTGHSHQAWPDVAFDAQQRAWLDAADLVDDKWARVAEVADLVRDGWRRLLTDPHGELALGQNTHELIVRLLSAVLPMFGATHGQPSAGRGGSSKGSSARTTILTTDAEFHTLRRQLDRLAEEGLDIVKVTADPADTLSERLAAVIHDRVACVMVSSVLFETAEIVPNLRGVAEACARHDVTLLVDAYHHLNVVPLDIKAMGLESAFIVGGGYKYCQLGEGNCFLRLPADCDLRPVFTGWFAEFGQLAESARDGHVPFGRGAARFAGATYDPTAHYRAAAVFAFHQEQGLTPDTLRAVSRHQVSLLAAGFEALDLDPRVARHVEMPADRRAGFLAIRSPHASALVTTLRARGLFVDARGEILRLGPAPYLSDRQIGDAIALLGEAVRGRDP